MTKREGKKLDAFHQRCSRTILGITCQEHVTNAVVLRRMRQKPLQDVIAKKRWRMAGHIIRLPHERPAPGAFEWISTQRLRKRGRPRVTWRKTFEDDLHKQNLSWDEAITVASDRDQGWYIGIFNAKFKTFGIF